MEKIGIAEKKIDFSYKNIQYKMRCNIKYIQIIFFQLETFRRRTICLDMSDPALGQKLM